MTDLPYSLSVPVSDLPPHGLQMELVPDAAQRAALARHVGVLAVSDLKAALHIAPEGKEGVHVTGHLTGTVSQTCGVTLEAFDAPVSESVDVHFVPAGSYTPPEDPEESDEDPPDEIVDGSIDAGALVGEFLVLGVDPYPRKPGAVFEPPAEEPGALSPFAALARLKDDK